MNLAPVHASVTRLLLALALAVLTLLAAASARAEPTFPALSGRVVDDASLLSETAERRLDEKLAQLEADTGRQLVVATIRDLGGYEIEDYGYRLGREWGVGRRQANDGALLIVAPRERKVRIEVGYGLEPVLTDALSAQIIQRNILPAFRTGHFEAGITAGVDALDAQLRLDPEVAQARAEVAGRPRPGLPVAAIILVSIVFLFILVGAISAADGGRRGRRVRRDGAGPVLVWTAAEALHQASRGGGAGRRSGGFGSGGFGGGFRGGGGSFGGGGASGGW